MVNAAADSHEDEDLFGAVSRLALAAEQGSDAAALNAAWMAHRGLGRAGRKALDFAARLYERAAKHGSSAGAVELAHLILNAEHLGMSRPCNVSEVRSGTGQAVHACSMDIELKAPQRRNRVEAGFERNKRGRMMSRRPGASYLLLFHQLLHLR